MKSRSAAVIKDLWPATPDEREQNRRLMAIQEEDCEGGYGVKMGGCITRDAEGVEGDGLPS
jgi:hypothetical protein